MKAALSKSLRCWRWVFIVVETVVVVSFLGQWIADRLFNLNWEPDSELPALVLGGLMAAAWLFLLVGSPFFMRSMRGLAFTGWAIAVAVFLLGLCSPAR